MEPVSTTLTTIKLTKSLVESFGFNANSWSNKYGLAPAQIDNIYHDPNYFVVAWKNGYFETYASTIPDDMSIGDLFYTYFGLDQYKYLYLNFNLNEIEFKRFYDIQPSKADLLVDNNSIINTGNLINNNTLLFVGILSIIAFIFLIKKKG